MTIKGRQHIISKLTWMVLIFCVWSRGTCYYSYNCPFKNTTSVSRSDPPRPISSYFRPTLTPDFTCLLMLFIADKETGQVCFQYLDYSGINPLEERNIELQIYDGERQIFLVKGSSIGLYLLEREYCSTSRSLEFLLKKNGKNAINPDLIYINFQVIHIESIFRVIIMNDGFCGKDFKIANSRVRVYSKFPEIVRYIEICLLTFEKVLQERQLCLFYKLRSEKWAQLFDWELYVSVVKYSLSPENVVYKFNSKNESSGKWCDEANREKIFVIYKTNQTEPFQSDPPVFMILVTDVENQSTNSENSVTPWWSMDYTPTQSTSSRILSTPENGFSDSVSSHRLAVILTIVITAAIVVLFCCYLAYTQQPRANKNEEAVTQVTESVVD